MCHNDIHRGNVLRNKGGELDPEEIALVDFDAAQYGYRTGNMPPTLANHMTFLNQPTR